MSLFEHLVERALELARPVEPVIDPSRLGPPTIGPSGAVGFEETIVEVTAGRPSPRSSTSVVTWDPPASPTASRSISEGRPARGLPSVVVPRGDSRAIGEAPRLGSVIAPASASGPTIVEREATSVIVERRVEPRVERTRELIREHERTIESQPAIATTLERAVRIPGAAPVEPRIERRGQAPRGEPSVVVIEAAPTIAGPVLPVASRPAPQPIISPVVPTRRGESSGVSPAGSQPITSRMAPPDPGPTLRIEIGRVIVRAESPAPQRRTPAASARPATSLADYLAGRDRGER
jgi:hypothetical protein